MPVTILDTPDFPFNDGRGLRPDQIDWSEADSQLDTKVQAIALTDAQIPDSIMRDSEFTAAAIRGLLSLSADELNDLLTGATIVGQTLTFTQNDGTTVPIAIPTAMAGSGDGVVQSGVIDDSGTELTLTLDNGGTVQIDIPTILRGSAGVSETRVQELINATALSALQGQVTDGQIPAAIMRDAEFTAAAVRNLLGLTAQEVNDLVTGATISGQTLTLPQNDGTNVIITIPTAMAGSGDGVVASGAFNNDQTELVLTLDTGGTVTINVPEALRGGTRFIDPNADGTLPSAADNQGKFVISGNYLLESIDHGGHDKEVTFKEYGPDRVVVDSEPVISANEALYGGSFEFPPHDDIADYDTNTVLWDRGAEVWLLKPAADSTRWSSYSGPLGWEHGHLYPTEADAARHISSVLAVGKIYIYGYGSTQKPYIVTSFTAATDPVWQWDPIGLTPGDVSGAVEEHDEATDSHTDIRTRLDNAAWSIQIDTKLVPQLNENAITDARISLRSSGGTHHLAFLDWTDADLDRINHLPVGGHIGLRQGVTTRILRVEAVWDSTNNRYEVTNVNSGVLTEASSGTDTELLFTTVDVSAEIATHDGSGTAHNSIRSLISAVEDRLDAIGVRDILEIAAYESDATYSFGGSNSIVTHGGNILVYISSVERNADHDPSLHPNYWGNLSRLATEISVDNTTNTHFRRGMLIYTHEDEVYLCTTNAQAATARDLTYVKENSGIGGEFINLTDKIPTTWKGPHVIGSTYKAGDRVTTNANTRIYTARVETAETPPHADWIQTGPVGSGGGGAIYVASSGVSLVNSSANHIELTHDDIPDPPTDGTRITFIPSNDNTGAVQIRIGTDDYTLQKSNEPNSGNAAMSAGDIEGQQPFEMTYSGSAFWWTGGVVGSASRSNATGGTDGHSPVLSSGDAFTTSPTPVANDLHFFFADVASGLDWKDTDGTTDITSADNGDVARFNGTDWVKLGNRRGPTGEEGPEGPVGTGIITGFTELRTPATLTVAQTWTATGATIPDADGDEWVRINGNFDGEVPENFEFLSSRLRSLAEHLVGGSTTTGDVERLQFHDGSVFQRVFLARTAANELIMRHETADQALGNLAIYSYSSIAGDGHITLTPRTESAHNFSFDGTIQSGQERDLFDTNIILPTDLDDDTAFIVRVTATHGSAEIVLTKDLLEELVAVAPVTWSTSATGTAAVNSGATQNVYFMPLGQNRGAYVGRSNEDPLRLLWAYSHNGAVVLDMQLMTLTAAAGSSEAGQQSPAGVAALTASYVHTLFYKYAEDEPSAHAANWRFDDEWSNTDGPPSDSWYNTAAAAEENYLLNPDNDNTDAATLWECRGQFRRRLNADGDAYLYNDSKEVFAVWGEEFSEDADSWHGAKTDDDVWQRIRKPLGGWGTPTYIGAPSAVDWEVLHAFQNVYRTSGSYNLTTMETDLTLAEELRFRMYGLASGVTRRAPIIEQILTRPDGGWPVVSALNGNFVDDNCFQWRYGAQGLNFDVVLMGDMETSIAGHTTQEVVGSDPNDVYTVTIGAGGRFKFYSPNNEENNVDSIIWFDQPGTFQRVRVEVSRRV